ncbi:hypothetical protein AB3S75_033576 [Citrus x aurantiifolia]
MDCGFSVHQKNLPKSLFRLLQSSSFYNSCNFSYNVDLASVQDWRCPVCPLASNSSHRQMQTLAWTLAYLIYDLVCCLFDQRVNVDNTIHHLISIVGIGASLIYEKISSPFLHCREMLKELGYRDTGLILTADVTFAAIFTFARMVCEPYLTYLTPSARNPIINKAMALGLQLVRAV